MTSPLEEYKRRQKIETLILLLTSDGVTSCCSARISTRPLTSLKSVKMHFERATAYTLLACKLKSLQWRWHRRLLRPYCAPKRRTRHSNKRTRLTAKRFENGRLAVILRHGDFMRRLQVGELRLERSLMLPCCALHCSVHQVVPKDKLPAALSN
ncbi:uncharacterized protein ACBT44_000977 isoform 1-T4 [Syngnathus typhle]